MIRVLSMSLLAIVFIVFCLLVIRNKYFLQNQVKFNMFLALYSLIVGILIIMGAK